MPEWYESAFDREYLDLYAHRDELDAERALAFLEAQGLIAESDLTLDLCCGNGRHSLAMCRRGYRVVGLDLSRDLLLDFRRRADCPVPLVRGDMRRIPFHRAFDLVVSLFTSFGYFEDDAENWQVLRGVAESLRPNGRFVFDFLNAPQAVSSLVARSIRELDEEVTAEERRRIEGGRVVKAVTLLRGGKPLREWEESVRLFERGEIEHALAEVGFGQIRAHGDFDASDHSDSSPRLILTASLQR